MDVSEAPEQRRPIAVINKGDHSRRPRLLLLAFLCRPGVGSEPGTGWNLALQAAKRFDCWVLCDEHLNGAAIRHHLKQRGPLAGIEFVFVPSSRWERWLRRLPAVCYIAYNVWHRRAFRIARKLHGCLRFDLTHQVTLGTFREPGYLWKLDAPFVWGPIGGTQLYPWRFLGEAGLVGAVFEGLRNLANSWQLRFSWRIRRAGHEAAALLAATSTNQRDFHRACKLTPSPMLDVGIQRLFVAARTVREEGGPLRILWSGDLRPLKALSLLIKALALLPDDVPYELRILGKGPLKNRWQRMARRLGVERHTTWMGFLPHEEAIRQYDWSDLFVFTSLRDTSGTVLVEALAAGVPVVCLDHYGGQDIVSKECGVKVPVTTPRETARQLSEAIASLARDRKQLELLGRGACERARRYLWSQQGAAMAAVYHQVLEDAGNDGEASRRVSIRPFCAHHTVSSATREGVGPAS